ncbi:ThuA domain-containing protein [Lacunimicrobium album]
MPKLLVMIFLVVFSISNRSMADEPHIVFIVSEPEYQTEVTLPAFADAYLKPLGYKSEFVFSSKDDANRFENLDALKTADVVVVSVRRRTPPVEQMELIKSVMNSKVGLVGIRTACHAFSLRNKPAPEGEGEWPTIDADVWGGSYTNHYPVGPVAAIRLNDKEVAHPILKGITATTFPSQGSLYMVAPVNGDATLLAFGEIEGKPKEPVAWTRLRGEQRVFFTSLGHKTDFEQLAFNTMLTNAIEWAGRLK